jgi:hypothetical protein
MATGGTGGSLPIARFGGWQKSRLIAPPVTLVGSDTTLGISSGAYFGKDVRDTMDSTGPETGIFGTSQRLRHCGDDGLGTLLRDST